jgi:CcmD family protein
MKTLKRWCALVWLSAAAPLLIGAYAFVMAVLFLYVLSVARRLTNVQQEISRLDSAIKQGHKG